MSLICRLVVVLLVANCAFSFAKERYQILTNSGEVTWHAESPDHDPHETRYVRDAANSSRLQPPFVEMTNGDVVCGRVVELVINDIEQGWPAHFTIQTVAANDSVSVYSPLVRVRKSNVKRIVHAQTSRKTAKGEKSIVLRDGRRLVRRQLRWSPGGIQLLTDDGVVSASFDQLTELNLDENDRIAGLMNDARWSQLYPDDRLARLHLTDGVQLTFPHSRTLSEYYASNPIRTRRQGKDYESALIVQPSWSLEPIVLNSDQIVSRTYRDFNEVPVSLLPVADVKERVGSHHWPWQRNASVEGGLLNAGAIVADLGLGTHSHNELTLELPPSAKTFSTFVALDRSVGNGGCVRCRVYVDSTEAEPIWESDFLRGSSKVVKVGPLKISGAKRLVLVTEFAHEDRPEGAEPLDIRDHVNWVLPMVTIDLDSLPSVELSHWVSALQGWSLADKDRSRIELEPVWCKYTERWHTALTIDGDKPIKDVAPLTFRRKVPVSLANSWLNVDARRAKETDASHEIEFTINDSRFGSTMNGHIRTLRPRRHSASRVWILGKFAGEEVTLSMTIHSVGEPDDHPSPVQLDRVMLRPLIDNLPANGKPIEPDIPLTSLKPSQDRIIGSDHRIEPGKLTDGRDLNIRGYPFHNGFAVPVGSEMTYKLDPSWSRFVAVIGLSDGWKGAGPYQILLDDKVFWTSPVARYGRNNPGTQINIAIPPGHKTITLRVSGVDCFGAWADSGFLKSK